VPTIVYTSEVHYEPARIHAAAVYCSDGRVGEHFDEFLQDGLHLPRYDRVALPGGPACLAGYAKAYVERDGVREELRFLVEVHKLERLVLIAHQGCAFYSQRLALPDDEIEVRQREDLARAADFIRETMPGIVVETFFARPMSGRIAFERVNSA